MSKQELRGQGANAYLYQETTGSTAIGIDAADSDKFKIVSQTTAGALISGTPQFTIDPAANGSVLVDPNGTGELQLVSGNFDFPETTASTSGVISQNGNRFIHTYDPVGTGQLFMGSNAGNFTMTGGRNTAFGTGNLQALTTGSFNTAVGHAAGLYVTTGGINTAIGMDALGKISGDGGTPTTGNHNTALGFQALATLTSGDKNVALGNVSAWRVTTGGHNVAIGGGDNTGLASDGTLLNLTTGSYNIAIGSSTGVTDTGAGNQYKGAESSNIVIGPRTVGTTGESNTMRLGTTGAGAGQVNRAFIAGTHGITPAGASIQNVVIDSSGQLGSAVAAFVPMPLNVNTTTPIALAVNNSYAANVAGLLTYTLPAVAAAGDIIEVTNFNTAVGWRIAQNASQLIRLGTSVTTTGVGGYLEATALGDSVTLKCIVANTTFQVLNAIGNITVV